MDWRAFAGLVIVGFSACAVLMQISKDYISPAAAIVVFSIAMLLTALGFFIYQAHTQAEIIRYSWLGVLIMACAGIANTAGDLSLILAMRHGAPLSTLAPVVDAGSVVLTVIASYFLLKESINIVQFIGISLCISGIILTVRG